VIQVSKKDMFIDWMMPFQSIFFLNAAILGASLSLRKGKKILARTKIMPITSVKPARKKYKNMSFKIEAFWSGFVTTVGFSPSRNTLMLNSGSMIFAIAIGFSRSS